MDVYVYIYIHIFVCEGEQICIAVCVRVNVFVYMYMYLAICACGIAGCHDMCMEVFRYTSTHLFRIHTHTHKAAYILDDASQQHVLRNTNLFRTVNAVIQAVIRYFLPQLLHEYSNQTIMYTSLHFNHSKQSSYQMSN